MNSHQRHNLCDLRPQQNWFSHVTRGQHAVRRFLIAVVLLLTLVACGDEESDSGATGAERDGNEVVTTVTAEAAVVTGTPPPDDLSQTPVGSATQSSAAATSPDPASQSAEARCLQPNEEELLRLINEYRREQGLNTLDPVASLNVAAYRHSLDMGQRNYFAHQTMDPLPDYLSGPQPWDRTAAEGYPERTTQGENLAAGQESAQSVFDGWRNSPEHNEIMIDPAFVVIGIGHAVVEETELADYWTADFGGQDAPAPDC